MRTNCGAYQSTRQKVVLILMLCSWIVVSCTVAKPLSPQPTQVLAVLRHYPGAMLVKDDYRQQISGAEQYSLVYTIQTTVEDAVAYYEPRLTALGIHTRLSQPSSRDMITSEGLPVDHWWWFDGCPLHSITLSLAGSALHLMYSTGACH